MTISRLVTLVKLVMKRSEQDIPFLERFKKKTDEDDKKWKMTMGEINEESNNPPSNPST